MPHENHLFQYECDAILFDLDGVLVDSRHCTERLWKAWANQHNLNIDKVLHYVHGRREVETIHLVAPQLDAQYETEQLWAMQARDTEGLVKILGAAELLQSIPGDAWGIATSGTHAIAATRLGFAGLPVPDVLISDEDVSASKPDPEPYLFAALMLGVKPARCVVIEDAPAGIQAARAAGMHAIGIISTAYPADELSQAHVIVRKISDIEVHMPQGNSQARLLVRVKGI
jgi:mannitol-1-/sugar-/sorbitol-6-phosphatase